MNSQSGIKPSDLKPTSTWTFSSSIAEDGAVDDLALLHASCVLAAKSSAKLPAGRLGWFADRSCGCSMLLWPSPSGAAGFPGFRPRIGRDASFVRCARRDAARASAIQRSQRSRRRRASIARASSVERSRHAGERPLDRLAIGDEDLGPQLRIAARDAREVSEARARHLARRPAVHHRGRARRRRREHGERDSSTPPRSRARPGRAARHARRAPRQKASIRATAAGGIVRAQASRRRSRPRRGRCGRARGPSRGCPPSDASRRSVTPAREQARAASRRAPTSRCRRR